MAEPRIILEGRTFDLTIERLCHQLIEEHGDFVGTSILGVQSRGIHLSRRIDERLKALTTGWNWDYGLLDPTFYRDDFRRRDIILKPAETAIDFAIEGKKVILIDDVFYTGRTIRAAMDGLLHFGRPAKVELLVLIDRRYSRHLPIAPDYVGKTVDVVTDELVRVEWEHIDGKDRVWITAPESEQNTQ
ncbi:MAG: pyrimidine operon attenuation protein/uracil phosphoribosyltransferase [Limisphaerales bacterium]|jgi:pyrimidine operon attenuation protein/uracil phosphoribosyltransferase